MEGSPLPNFSGIGRRADREEIIAANPLPQFVQARGFDLKPEGQNFVTNGCPVAQHKPGHRPVTIYTEKQSWYCHDCKQGGSVIDWVMQEKHIPFLDALREFGGHTSEPAHFTYYEYTDKNGTPLFRAVRKERKGQKKRFWQEQPDGNGGWIPNLKGVPLVLYHLPEIIAAQMVCVPEGEKDADNLRALGFTATTNPMGAENWLDQYSEFLRDKDVVIFGDVGDPDKKGEKHTAQRIASLTGVARSLKHVKLPEGFHDISDYIASLDPKSAAHVIWKLIQETPTLKPVEAEKEAATEFSPEQLRRAQINKIAKIVIAKCKVGEPVEKIESYLGWQVEKLSSGNHMFPTIIDASEFFNHEPPPEPPQIIRHILKPASKMLLGGASKAYKTWTLMDINISVACGVPWWGFETNGETVCYINLELQAQDFERRFRKICEVKRIQPDAGKFHVWNLRGYAKPMKQLIHAILPELEKHHFSLVTIDPVYKTLPDRPNAENDSAIVTQLLNDVEMITSETGASVLFAAHFPKGDQSMKESMDRVSGSGAWARDADTHLTMTQHKQHDCFSVEAHFRSLPRIRSFVVQWDYPLFIREDQLNPDELRRKGGRPPKDPKALREFLSFDEGKEPGKIVAYMKKHHDWSRATVYRVKDQLVDLGEVKIENELWYRVSPEDIN